LKVFDSNTKKRFKRRASMIQQPSHRRGYLHDFAGLEFLLMNIGGCTGSSNLLSTTITKNNIEKKYMYRQGRSIHLDVDPNNTEAT
jgi:hypothetical protein